MVRLKAGYTIIRRSEPEVALVVFHHAMRTLDEGQRRFEFRQLTLIQAMKRNAGAADPNLAAGIPLNELRKCSVLLGDIGESLPASFPEDMKSESVGHPEFTL